MALSGEPKKWLKSIRHISSSIKPHAFHSASRGTASSPPHAASFALALYFLSIIFSFPRWEMVLSLCSCPDALSTQGPVDLWGFFFSKLINVFSLMVCNIKLSLFPLLSFHWFESFFTAGTAIFQWGCLFKNYWILRIFQPWAFLDVTLTSFLRPLFLLGDFCRIAFLSKARIKDEYCTQSFSKLLLYTSKVRTLIKH